MLNVPELERRWRRYRIRRYLPYAGGVSILMLLAVGAVIFYFEPEPEPKPVKMVMKPTNIVSSASYTSVIASTAASGSSSTPAQTSAEPIQTAVQTTVQQPDPIPVPSKPKPKKEITKLAPSMQFLQDFESDVMKYYGVETPKKSAPLPETDSVIPPAPVEVKQPEPVPSTVQHNSAPQIVTKPKGPSSSQMIIQRENDLKDIQDVITRFKKNKNPALSLFVARRYYALGNYQQAYNYALITNDLNSHIEDSWLIFAKSLYKLDQKEMAIKTLRSYIKENGSIKAKLLLEQMQNGAF